MIKYMPESTQKTKYAAHVFIAPEEGNQCLSGCCYSSGTLSFVVFAISSLSGYLSF